MVHHLNLVNALFLRESALNPTTYFTSLLSVN